VKKAKEDTMATTFLDYHAMMAQLHVDELLREAAAARKVQAARAARRQREV
jgi:outer membrane murein-binding lipoprotein Lpp